MANETTYDFAALKERTLNGIYFWKDEEGATWWSRFSDQEHTEEEAEDYFQGFLAQLEPEIKDREYPGWREVQTVPDREIVW